jgi:hypothetical protein
VKTHCRLRAAGVTLIEFSASACRATIHQPSHNAMKAPFVLLALVLARSIGPKKTEDRDEFLFQPRPGYNEIEPLPSWEQLGIR